MVKEYEMHVQLFLCEADGVRCIHKWTGSELFEAETKEVALRDAVESEFNDHKRITTHRKVGSALMDGVGTIAWINGSGQTLCEMITVSEYKRGEQNESR